MVFGLVTELCNHHHNLFVEHHPTVGGYQKKEDYPKKKPWTHEQSLPAPPGPATPSSRKPPICFVTLDLPILNISWTWNHTRCGLLHLTSFS